MIPSDYCFNRDNKGNSTYPRFLEWDGGRGYKFVGMGSSAMTALDTKPHPQPRATLPTSQTSPLSPGPQAGRNRDQKLQQQLHGPRSGSLGVSCAGRRFCPG